MTKVPLVGFQDMRFFGTLAHTEIVDLAGLEIRIARSENLPVLPQAVSAVLRLVDDPTSTPRQIERAVERDPAITAKVLRVANSAYYGGNRAATVGRAISFLGLNAIRSLVVSVAFQQMASVMRDGSSFSRLEFWRHSLAVASGSRLLARTKLPLKAEELFCAGMLHDLGLLVLERFMPDDLDAAVSAARQTGQRLHTMERLQMGFCHAEAGGLLGERWNLTPLMRRAIRFHHEPDEDGEFFETTLLVATADALAHQAGFTNNGGAMEVETPEAAFEVLNLTEEECAAVREGMVGEVLRAQEAFSLG